MNIILTRSAWTGLRRFLDDPLARLAVDNILALAGPLSDRSSQYVSATMEGRTISLVVAAYQRWSTSVHLGRS